MVPSQREGCWGGCDERVGGIVAGTPGMDRGASNSPGHEGERRPGVPLSQASPATHLPQHVGLV